MTKECPCTEFEERAAILEFMAGMTRPTAERKAREQIEARGRKQLDLLGREHRSRR